MKFLFVSNNLHVFQVGLDSPHHLSLIEGFFYIRFLYVWYLVDKGQIKSEQIYEVIDFPNYQLKNLKDLCHESFEVEYL